MCVEYEGMPSAATAEQPLSGLDLESVEIAYKLLGGPFEPENPSKQALSLAQHWRRMTREALHAIDSNKKPRELLQEAEEVIRAAIQANDGSLEQLIESSLLRQQSREILANYRHGERRSEVRFRSAGRTALSWLMPWRRPSTQNL